MNHGALFFLRLERKNVSAMERWDVTVNLRNVFRARAPPSIPDPASTTLVLKFYPKEPRPASASSPEIFLDSDQTKSRFPSVLVIQISRESESPRKVS
jgi:hypothetical protein